MTDSPSIVRRPLKDLRPKEALRGKITRVEPYGAFIDVAAEGEGLLHISQVQKEPINRIEDVLRPGQEVDVWVSRVDAASGRLEVSMLRPVGMDWSELKPGLDLRGKVIRLEKFGAFVDVGAERHGLLHVSELGIGRMADPSELIAVGDEVDVTVTDVDRKKKQFRLRMKELSGEGAEEAGPEIPTAMELALRKAMEASSGASKPGPASSTDRRAHVREEQEKILSRTLQHKLRTQSGSD